MLGRVWFFLVLGFLFWAAVAFGRTAAVSSEAFDLYLAQFENVSFEEEPLPHYKGFDESLRLYVFQSRKLKTSAPGYWGPPIDLIIAIAPGGIIKDVSIERSQESPQYLNKVKPWLDIFKEKNLFDFISSPVPVDTVTHATYSSAAIIETVSNSARLIRQDFFKQEAGVALPKKISGLIEALILIFFAFAGVFLFHKSRGRKIRFIFLTFLVLFAGIGFNLQFSFRHIINFLSFNLPSIFYFSLFALFFLPFVLGIFYGRFYCGWLCPFGALQEILSIFGRPLKVPKKIERKAVWIKYILLAGLIFIFFIGKDSNIYSQDPLARAFFLQDFFQADNFLTWIALFFSFFIVRFWCRYFCVVAAFLSLLNKIAFFKFVFRKKFSRCPWHVDKLRDKECVLCNKCLMD